MSKRPSKPSPELDSAAALFAELEDRKRRKLFLPKLLASRAGHTGGHHLATPARDRAHAIILKWADMETAGQLDKKETSLDAAFLREVFGDGLGYRGPTESPAGWECERQFHVPNVGDADGALGRFAPGQPPEPIVAIELKGCKTDLDKDKSNGRTAVQQLWDYLNALPASCQWGIVSNFSTLRLYHKDKGTGAYERFTLQELREPRRFAEFYWVCERSGLTNGALGHLPRALQLLRDSATQQAEVGDKLYEYYSNHRQRLIQYLHADLRKPLDESIRIAQKLLDRIIFTAFCEDRDLLPRDLIDRAYYDVPFLARVTNPKWQNFVALFHAIDRGHAEIGVPHGYNGGLFAHDPAVDDLELPDEPWTTFFKSIGDYDYRDEVNVAVLGHLFEKSITELELLRSGALFGPQEKAEGAGPVMPKSAQRKRSGTYYTPPDFTTAIVRHTVDELVAGRFAELRVRHQLTQDALEDPKPTAANQAYWRDALALLRDIKIVDPACGSGAFLIQAYDAMRLHYQTVIAELAHQRARDAKALANAIPDMILADNLYGVDLAQEAVEITQLSLWIASARQGKTLSNLSANIVCGNSLVTDPAVHPQALNWREKFPAVFSRPGDQAGFDCVIGNPPWERMKLQEREFFSLSAPEIAGAVNAATRRTMIAELETKNPPLYARYQEAGATADKTLAHVRASGEFPLTAQGDINTYMLFAELGRKIVAPTGRVGLLVPSGISTDKTTAEFFHALMDGQSLIVLHDFENKRPYFPDVHRSFKFSVLVFGGSTVKAPTADFVFFARDIGELQDPDRHIDLSAKDMKRMNPNTLTCPVFRTRRDAELTKAIYARVPVLIDRNRKSGGNPWGVSFLRMFDQTNDAELFQDAIWLLKQAAKPDGNRWRKGKKTWLPLYEAKMVQAFDHRAASVEVVAGNWMRQGQTVKPSLVEHQNPEHLAMPRWWVTEEDVAQVMGSDIPPALLAYKDVTSPTNQRTMIAAFIPQAGTVNSAPLILTKESPRRQCCLLANLNSFAYDFIARQKVGGIHLNFFIVEQLPTFPPDTYADKCPWSPGTPGRKQTLEQWISERVLKLTCTANDLRPLAEACDFAQPDYLYKWKPAERAQLRAELDAAYFHLYGFDRADAAYILGTFAGNRAPDDEQTLPAADADVAETAEVNLAETAKLVLEAYDRLGGEK
jgi:hypothetical protein